MAWPYDLPKCPPGWQPISLAPDGELVDTKIHDEEGDRNHALLKRRGNLWFLSDGSMYVYYTPTHWRRLSLDEQAVALTRPHRESPTSSPAVSTPVQRPGE